MAANALSGQDVQSVAARIDRWVGGAVRLLITLSVHTEDNLEVHH
jgi:hypothetical protein